MSVIRYDVADLDATAARLAESVEVAREIDGSAGALAGAVSDCGSPELAEAVRDLLDRWGYGMRVVAEDADALGEALHEAARTYEGIDGAAADALRGG